MFRLKDAIAKEARERRIPDETVVKPRKEAGSRPMRPGPKRARRSNSSRSSEHPDRAEETEPADGDDAAARQRREWDPALLDGVRAADEQIDVNRFLEENIKDDRKRLAFRLFMDDLPFKSKYHSIAKALGIDEKNGEAMDRGDQAQLKEKIGDLT